MKLVYDQFEDYSRPLHHDKGCKLISDAIYNRIHNQVHNGIYDQVCEHINDLVWYCVNEKLK